MTDDETQGPERGGIRGAIRRRPWLFGGGAVVVVAVGAWLVFGVFAVQTLFIDDEVDEANPFEEAAAQEDPPPTTAADDGPADDAEPAPTTEPAPVITTVSEGQFISRDHPTSGTAQVITDGAQTFLRFTGFETDNGPDLNVYLATGDPEGDLGDFVDLGTLKGNIGDQNYELTGQGIDLDRYSTVYIWCVRFGVPFGAAGLA